MAPETTRLSGVVVVVVVVVVVHLTKVPFTCPSPGGNSRVTGMTLGLASTWRPCREGRCYFP